MRFVCESCRAQYMINDEKVGPKGVKVRCRKCGYVILVKRGGDAGAKGPVSSAGADPDDALATQVLQTPLTAAAPAVGLASDTMADLTNPGIPEDKVQKSNPRDSLLGDAGDDEIGAVFDQVLNSGAHSISQESLGKGEEKPTQVHAAVNGEPLGGGDDDRMSTRVIDGDVVRKLAEEMGEGAPARAEKNGHAETEVPQTDWFAAIDEKQTGPLTLEKMKEHWDRGELGPDSLCWRAGFTDWVPLSDVAQLASVLAPRPASKPIVMNAPAGAPNVVSVPVESAFSAGGMMKSVRSEVQVPMAATGAIEETGSWRPSAANSLGSLLKEEKEALARPAPRPMDDHNGPAEVSIGGLLDLPSPEGEKSQTNGHAHAGASVDPGQREAPVRPARPAPPPANPYVATPGATYSSPGITQYRPASNRNLLVGIGVGGGVIVLMLFGLVIFLLGKQQGGGTAEVRPPPVVLAQNTPPPVAQPPPVVPQPVPLAAQPVPTTAVAQPAGQTPAPTTAQPAANTGPVPPKASGNPLPPHSTGNGSTQVKAQPTRVAAAEKAPPPEKEEKPAKVAAKESKGGEKDEFDEAFGDPKAKKETPKSADSAPGKKTVYIPPAPGAAQADVKDTLGQADVMEVVMSHKPELAKCVNDQHTKEPGVSGKLVMKWVIATSGAVTKVSVESEDFKSTYVAGCIGGLIKTWKFPKAKTAGDPVVFPFKF